MKVGDIVSVSRLELGYIYNFISPSDASFKVTRIVGDSIFIAYHDTDYTEEKGLLFKSNTYRLMVEYVPTELEKALL